MLLASLSLAACNTTQTAEAPDMTQNKLLAQQSLHSSPVEDSLPTVSLEDIEFEHFEQLYLKNEDNHSIWPRLRAGFQLPEDINHPSLQSEINWYARHETYLHRVMNRADPFM